MKRILLTLALVASCAEPVLAQGVTRAEVDSIKRGLGSTTKVFAREEPCPYILANGEYDVFCRQRKLNFAIDDLVADNIRLKQSNLDLKQQLDALVVRVGILEAKPSNSTNVVASGSVAAVSDDQGGGHYAALSQAQLELKANTLHNVTQSGITSTYCGLINQNGWDGALRLQQNMKGQPTHCAPELPGGQFGGDSRFTFSYSQYPEDAMTVPATQTYGQSLVVDGGFAQAGYSYVTGAQLPLGILIAAQRAGQPIYFGVTPTRNVGEYPQNRVPFAVESDNSDSPIQLTASGQEGRVQLCTIGAVKVLCFKTPPAALLGPATRPVMKLPNPRGTLDSIPTPKQ